jgi:UDP-glucose 4-epimerase
MSKNILIAGGAGYIGSHMVRVLLEEAAAEGYRPIVFDNLSTGFRGFVPKGVPFIKGDLRNIEDIRKAFKKYKINTVMHFAASICVPESVENPLKYYENNVSACINLLKVMIENRVKYFIFSSTAAVYGEPKKIPVTEDNEKKPTSPYGASKLMMEQILKDTAFACDFSYVSLRYFNAAGAHASGKIGQQGKLITHLIPNILKAAKDGKKELVIFGDSYPTKDGTCIRDYIHVMDLCSAHLLAMRALHRSKIKNEIFNLGSGKGFTVKEMVQMAEEVTGRKIKVKIGPRRPGDPARIVASPRKARRILRWEPKSSLEDIIKSSWRFENLKF